jgi:hypothetical protein
LDKKEETATAAAVTVTTATAKQEEKTQDDLPVTDLTQVAKELAGITKRLDQLFGLWDNTGELQRTEQLRTEPLKTGSVDRLFALDVPLPSPVENWLSVSAVILMARIVRGDNLDFSSPAVWEAFDALQRFGLVAGDPLMNPRACSGDPMAAYDPEGDSASCEVRLTPKGLSLYGLIRSICNRIKFYYRRDLCGAIGIPLRGRIDEGVLQ